MKKNIFSGFKGTLVIGLFLSFQTFVHVHAQEPASVMSSAKFLQAAAITGMNTVALGSLGEKRLQNPEIKNYALEVLNNQIAANVRLKALAKRKKIKLPDPMTIPINSMQTRVDTAVKDTANSSPDSLKMDFDKDYIQMAMDDHQKAISLYEQGLVTTDRDVKNYARKQLPLLRKQLLEAKRLSVAVAAKK